MLIVRSLCFLRNFVKFSQIRILGENVNFPFSDKSTWIGSSNGMDLPLLGCRNIRCWGSMSWIRSQESYVLRQDLEPVEEFKSSSIGQVKTLPVFAEVENDARVDLELDGSTLSQHQTSTDESDFGTIYYTTDDHLLPQESTLAYEHATEEQEVLDMKDAPEKFEAVWNEIEKEFGREKMVFPKEIIWLMGAPGAGKGTNVPFIMTERDISAEAIEISNLLSTEPMLREVMAKGLMVSDSTVLNLLLRKLLEPEYQNGAVVDGFPRTQVGNVRMWG
jgi:hypothetical protein